MKCDLSLIMIQKISNVLMILFADLTRDTLGDSILNFITSSLFAIWPDSRLLKGLRA